MSVNENIDSREGFDSSEELAYNEGPIGWDMIEGDDEPTPDDLDEMVRYWDDATECEYDGQPDEYTEWQDVSGGDDWDHGQYDHYDEY